MGLQSVSLTAAICSWQNGPGEAAHTALEWNFRTPRCTVQEMSVNCGRVHPLHLANFSPMRRAPPRTTRWVAILALIELILPKWQWTSGQRDSLGRWMGIMQAREEGRVYIPPAPHAWSATHLLWAFRVKVALEKWERNGLLFWRKLDDGESIFKTVVYIHT